MDDAIVVVAAVETIKRAWSDSGGISAALATVVTKDEDRFIVFSRGGESMNALLGLNPGDVARFTGRLSPPFNIELSRVAPIERSGRVEAWREQWILVSTDRLSPDFRSRVAGLKLQSGECTACDGSIEVADQIALIMLRDRQVGMICANCGMLPRDELVEKLNVVEGAESDPALFVTHAKMAECAIARFCGLDPNIAIDWSVDGEWDFGLGARFGLVRKEPPEPIRRNRIDDHRNRHRQHGRDRADGRVRRTRRDP
jgi:hypothetical protein